MKSKVITIDQIQVAYNNLMALKKREEDLEYEIDQATIKFNNLVNRASQKTLAKFVREGDILDANS